MSTSKTLKTNRKSKINELVTFDKEQEKMVIGTDEAGRGPLAGPVVAGAVYFPEFSNDVIEVIKYIDDSKKLSEKIRKELALRIKEVAIYSIAECSAREIEKHNILQASLLAMKRACEDVLKQIKADNVLILVDGNFIIPRYKVPQKAIKKGDSISAAIAAASILAKVHRDEIMLKLAEKFPVYEWHKNKGYPTATHIKAVREHGSCKHHRKTFLSKITAEQQKLPV